MVTIRKIAERLGVSTATVSKALNRAPGIGEDTAERIRETAREMGYMPNAAAQALKTRRTHSIGVLTMLWDESGMGHDFTFRILATLQEEAGRAGYDITLLSERQNRGGMTLLEHCRYRNFDGVAMVCPGEVTDSMRAFFQSDIPCVCVDCLSAEHGAVMTDNERAMRSLVDYVCGRGHRRIAFIHGEDGVMVTRHRMAGFYRAAEAYNLNVPQAYIESALYNDLGSTRAATGRLLSLPEPPSCIFFPDDFAYMGGLAEIEARGLSVPEDVSCVGFDGIYLSRVMRPPLTTYRQDAAGIAREAFHMLEEAMLTPKTHIPRQKFVPGLLLEGGTVQDVST